MSPIDLFIAALFGFAVIVIGAAILVASSGNRDRIRARLRKRRGQTIDEQDRAAKGTFGETVSQIGTMVSNKGPSKTLQAQMLRAGWHSSGAMYTYMGTKIILMAFLAIILTFVSILLSDLSTSLRLFLPLFGAIVAFFLPNIFLNYRIGKRGTLITQHVPDMVDLLEICVSGGMGLDQAWNAVADEIRTVCPTLADEMALTTLEIHLGEDRGDAMRHMAERTGATELSSLVAVLVQSEKFGTSVAEALRTFAETMRQLRSNRAEEAAEKMAVKMLFPMIVFIFPVVIIVAVGPAGIRLVEVLGGQ